MQKRYLQTGESPEEGNCDLGRAGVIDMQGKAEETGFDQPEGWGDICLQHPRASKRVTENAETNILHGCTVKGKKPQSQFAEGKLQLDLRKKKMHNENDQALEQVVREPWETVLGDFSKLGWTSP